MRTVCFLSLLLISTGSSFVIQSLPHSKKLVSIHSLHASGSSPDEAEKLLQKAEKLRQEVAKFQQQKMDVENEVKAKEEKAIEEKIEIRERYSAEVPILKGDGQEVVEQIDFPPRWGDGKSYVNSCEASLPLGIILGESEEMSGLTVVDEVVEGGNGSLAGVQVGDILRACTACQAMMKAPAWQIIAGGIGQPETRRFMYNVDGRPFEEVMEAIGSNRMDPAGRPVVLVLEKREE